MCVFIDQGHQQPDVWLEGPAAARTQESILFWTNSKRKHSNVQESSAVPWSHRRQDGQGLAGI